MKAFLRELLDLTNEAVHHAFVEYFRPLTDGWAWLKRKFAAGGAPE